MAKLSSSSTSWATARVAGAPDPIATPRSESLMASTSFTPSPVMATLWPLDCNAATIIRFCCGVTRPNTPAPCTRSANAAASSGSVRASTTSPESTPSELVTAPTEVALSPEITLTATFWSAKNDSVSRASGRTFCSSTTSAVGVRTPGASGSSTGRSASPSSRTRRPVEPRCSARVAASLPGAARTSGAPSTQCPCPSNDMPDHFLADVNGAIAVTLHAVPRTGSE